MMGVRRGSVVREWCERRRREGWMKALRKERMGRRVVRMEMKGERGRERVEEWKWTTLNILISTMTIVVRDEELTLRLRRAGR